MEKRPRDDEVKKWYVTEYVDIDTGEYLTKKHYKSFKNNYKIIEHNENNEYRTIGSTNWRITTRTNMVRHNGQTTLEI